MDLDVNRLRAVFARYPQIWAVYLFGSVAEGRARPDSDVDLGVVLRPGMEPPSKLDLLTDLVKAGYERVDLVFLPPRMDDPVLAFEVVRHHRVVYATPDFDHGALFSKALRMREDLLHLLAVHRRAYKERVLGGKN